MILGSSSPRRVELLKQIGLNFTVMKPETLEQMRPGELPQDYVLRNAEEKAQWVYLAAVKSLPQPTQNQPILVISADTVVVIDGKTLEKPCSHLEAFQMLQTLSGRTHTVMTGVTLLGHKLPASPSPSPTPSQEMTTKTFRVETQVSIKTLEEAEIHAYIKSGEPMDKAGGYAAQGRGSYMVERIEGSYANVVGLPVCDVVRHLNQHFGINIWDLDPAT